MTASFCIRLSFQAFITEVVEELAKRQNNKKNHVLWVLIGIVLSSLRCDIYLFDLKDGTWPSLVLSISNKKLASLGVSFMNIYTRSKFEWTNHALKVLLSIVRSQSTIG